MTPKVEKFTLQTSHPTDMTTAEVATELAGLAAEIARRPALAVDAVFTRLVDKERERRNDPGLKGGQVGHGLESRTRLAPGVEGAVEMAGEDVAAPDHGAHFPA